MSSTQEISVQLCKEMGFVLSQIGFRELNNICFEWEA